ncbi:phosphatidylserine/phosphatidylglycerophosphate/cardiolipin synthase family protein [Undibacterium arcticum]
MNISNSYGNSSLFRSKSRRDAKVGWRDTHIKIEGPAVAALQWLFLNNWASQKSPDLPDSNFFPPLKEVGDKLVRVLASEPDGDYDIYKAYFFWRYKRQRIRCILPAPISCRTRRFCRR